MNVTLTMAHISFFFFFFLIVVAVSFLYTNKILAKTKPKLQIKISPCVACRRDFSDSRPIVLHATSTTTTTTRNQNVRTYQ